MDKELKTYLYTRKNSLVNEKESILYSSKHDGVLMNKRRIIEIDAKILLLNEIFISMNPKEKPSEQKKGEK